MHKKRVTLWSVTIRSLFHRIQMGRKKTWYEASVTEVTTLQNRWRSKAPALPFTPLDPLNHSLHLILLIIHSTWAPNTSSDCVNRRPCGIGPYHSLGSGGRKKPTSIERCALVTHWPRIWIFQITSTLALVLIISQYIIAHKLHRGQSSAPVV